MNPDEFMDLAVAFDENFLVPFYALLASVFFNNKAFRFHFHVIATGLPVAEQEALKCYIEKQQGKLSFYNVAAGSLTGLVIPPNRHLTLATYYRLFFPLVVPNSVKRLLYLDTDVIVNGPLSGIYHKEMGSLPGAAVPEVNATGARPSLGIYEKGKYFNAGILLMNVPEWKQQQVTEKAVKFVHDFPEKIKFADQDALNAVLNDNYLPLEAKYNVVFQDVPKKLSDGAYKAFAADKIIIHYTLAHKPWNAFGKNRLRFLYFRYLKLTPKASTKKYTDLNPTPKNLLRFAVLRIREKAYNLPFFKRTRRQ